MTTLGHFSCSASVARRGMKLSSRLAMTFASRFLKIAAAQFWPFDTVTENGQVSMGKGQPHFTQWIFKDSLQDNRAFFFREKKRFQRGIHFQHSFQSRYHGQPADIAVSKDVIILLTNKLAKAFQSFNSNSNNMKIYCTNVFASRYSTSTGMVSKAVLVALWIMWAGQPKPITSRCRESLTLVWTLTLPALLSPPKLVFVSSAENATTFFVKVVIFNHHQDLSCSFLCVSPLSSTKSSSFVSTDMLPSFTLKYLTVIGRSFKCPWLEESIDTNSTCSRSFVRIVLASDVNNTLL